MTQEEFTRTIAIEKLEHAATYLVESRGLTDEDFPAETPDAHAVVLLDDFVADLRGQSHWYLYGREDEE